jgi:tetratricopeptide (TPR) repeat protein
VSLVEQSLRRNQIPQAKALLLEWEPPNESSSKLMRNAAFRWKFAMAKALRFEGNFSKARTLFQQLSDEATDQASFHGIQCRVVSNLADLYCELGNAEAAVDLLRPRIEEYTERGHEYFAQLLIISLAEALIQKGGLREAEVYLLQAASFYDGTFKPNNIAQMAHMRALAKISTIRKEAFLRWTQAKDAITKHEWGQGFTLGMIKFSVAYVSANTGPQDSSKKLMQAARDNLYQEGEGPDQY